MPDLVVKRGDTFKRTARYIKGGAPSAFAEDTTIRAQVRSVLPLDDDGTTLISDLDVTLNPDQEAYPGFFTLEKAYDAPDGTNAWPIGTHVCDIEYTFTDRRTSSRTFTIEVIADVSHDD